MHFFIHCSDKPDHGHVRTENRQAHLDYLSEFAGEAGRWYMLDDEVDVSQKNDHVFVLGDESDEAERYPKGWQSFRMGDDCKPGIAFEVGSLPAR